MGKAEAHVEGYLVKRIARIGGLTRKAGWVARRGAPDQRVLLPYPWRVYLWNLLGRHTLQGVQNPWVECKSLDGDVDGHQAREHKRMRDLGEVVLICNTRELVDHYFPLEIS